MPGVLIVEAMAQTGAIAVLIQDEYAEKSPSLPGSTTASSSGSSTRYVLTLTCEIDTIRGPIGRGKATAHVGNALAARGTLTFTMERYGLLGAATASIGITGLGRMCRPCDDK